MRLPGKGTCKSAGVERFKKEPELGRRHLVLLRSAISFWPGLFTEPMPAWFGKTAITLEKRINGRIHRYMALGNFCAGGDKGLDNLRVDLRIASMRRHVDAVAQQEFTCFSPSVPAGIAESRFRLPLSYARARSPIRKKELPHQLDAAHARRRNQVDVRAPLSQELRRAWLSVVQTSPDGRRVVAASARGFDGGAMTQK